MPEPAATKSPTRLIFERFLHNRIALTGGAVLLLLYLSAIFAPFIAPYSPYDALPNETFHPQHHLHFVDAAGHFHARPFIYRYELADRFRSAYATDASHPYPLAFFVKGWPYKLWGMIPCERHLFGVVNGGGSAMETRIHLFGTDMVGRDIFSRVLYGGIISLSVGIIGIVITLSLGMLVGGISGYFGGWMDTVLMRGVEVLMSVPGLYMILALSAALNGDSPMLRRIFRLAPGESLGSGQIYVMIIVILGLVGWGGTARVIRGIVLSVKELEYVQAARALGASNARIIVRHLLPNTITYVIVSATLSVPGYILGEVALSFLGVGIKEPTASWGLMLSDAHLNALDRFPWLLWPGAFIFLTVFAFNFLGDGLRDALDPKSAH